MKFVFPCVLDCKNSGSSVGRQFWVRFGSVAACPVFCSSGSGVAVEWPRPKLPPIRDNNQLRVRLVFGVSFLLGAVNDSGERFVQQKSTFSPQEKEKLCSFQTLNKLKNQTIRKKYKPKLTAASRGASHIHTFLDKGKKHLLRRLSRTHKSKGIHTHTHPVRVLLRLGFFY